MAERKLNPKGWAIDPVFVPPAVLSLTGRAYVTVQDLLRPAKVKVKMRPQKPSSQLYSNAFLITLWLGNGWYDVPTQCHPKSYLLEAGARDRET